MNNVVSFYYYRDEPITILLVINCVTRIPDKVHRVFVGPPCTEMLVTSSWIVDLLLLLVTAAVILYQYATRKFDYWKKRGVYNPTPVPFLGNMADACLFRTCLGEWMKTIYDSSDEPYLGIFVFDEPHLVIKSPELIKQILVKDFSNFSDKSLAQPKHNKMISNMIFFQKNPGWKINRAKVTPVFTSGKLKAMFPMIQDIGENLLAYLERNQGELEGRELCAKFSTDVIASCFLGINSNCIENEEADFRKIGRELFRFSWRNGLMSMAYFMRPKWVDTFKLDFIPKWISDFLHDVFSETLRNRKSGGARKNDLMDILKDLKGNDDNSSNMDLEVEEIIAPAVQFFVAGFETVSATISFALYELCMHKDVQSKLRTEIQANIEDHGGITYEGLIGMKYMDMCVKEALRMYPVLPFLDRTSKEEYTLPGTNLVLEKGLPVYIPLFGIHMDEKYFPEPKRFNPDRFLDNKNYNDEGLVYLPFGEGPRACIGERFGMMSTKAALANILSTFEVEKCPTTPDPVAFEPKSLGLQSDVGLPMIFKRIGSLPA